MSLRSLLVVSFVLVAAGVRGEDASPFQKEILPILEAKCIRCHGAKQKAGRLDLRTRESLLAGGEGGPAIVPGHGKKSLMYELMFYREMPPKREQQTVTDEELAKFREWIDAGAKE